MKKIFTLLCAAFLSLCALNAEVLLTEPFAQETETLATNKDALPYSGELDGWTNVWGGGNLYVNKSTDLTYTGYKSTTDNTGSAEYRETFARRVASPLSKSVSSGSVYMAGIVKISSIKSSGKDYLWALGVGTSGLNAASSKHYARPYVLQSGSGFKFGIAKLDETSSASYIDYTEDEYAFGTYLLVVEYTWKDGDNNDEIKLYVNPTKGDKPASATCVPNPTQAAKKADAASFGSVVLNSSNASQAACLIDEIKVVTDWADLWESGGASTDPDPTPVPSITAAGDLNFGNVNVNEEVSKVITVKGANLKGAINISSDNSAITLAPSVSKEDAETESGYELTVSLTATAAGDGSATITFSSKDATEESITATWSAVAPPDSVENIAELKGKTVYNEPYVIKTQPIVVGFIQGTPIIQDESGALPITDIWGLYSGYSALKVGDKLQNIFAYMMDDAGKIDIFPAAYLAGAPNLLSSDNEVIPLVGDPSNIASYGPAYIKLTEVQFPSDKDKFEKGYLDVTQGSETVKLYILDGELIDTALPAKADVKGLVSYKSFNGKVLEVSKLSEITNREEKIPTAIDNINSSSLQGGERGRLFLHNGQIIILRDNKTFNLLGTEIK